MKLTIDFGRESYYVQIYYASGDGKLYAVEQMDALVLFLSSFNVHVPSCQLLCMNEVYMKHKYSFFSLQYVIFIMIIAERTLLSNLKFNFG